MATAIPPEILAIAARVVDAEGPDALTMDRLARDSGVSRATLYRQCGGRETLLDALAATGTDVGDRTETRTRILTAAREVFGRAGFDAATIDEVATAAHVGTATVYRQFGDKDGLVAAFLDEITPRRAAREARAAATGDLRADLERLAETMLRGARDDLPVVRLVLLESLRDGGAFKRVRAMSPVRTLTAIASLFRAHASSGRLRDIDPNVLAQAFGGMIFAFGVLGPLVRGQSALDPAQAARTVTDLFLHGALASRRSR